MTEPSDREIAETTRFMLLTMLAFAARNHRPEAEALRDDVEFVLANAGPATLDPSLVAALGELQRCLVSLLGQPAPAPADVKTRRGTPGWFRGVIDGGKGEDDGSAS